MNRKAQKESSSKSDNRKAIGKQQRGTWIQARPGPGIRESTKAAAEKRKVKAAAAEKDRGKLKSKSGLKQHGK